MPLGSLLSGLSRLGMRWPSPLAPPEDDDPIAWADSYLAKQQPKPAPPPEDDPIAWADSYLAKQPPQATPSATQGLLTPGNIDLSHRTPVINMDGTLSTVRSISANIDGKEVLLPTVTPDGHDLTPKQAVDYYRRTGQHLGIFDTPQNATTYAQQLHRAQAQQVASPPSRSVVPQLSPNVSGGRADQALADKLGLTPEERRVIVGSEARLHSYLNAPPQAPSPPPPTTPRPASSAAEAWSRIKQTADELVSTAYDRVTQPPELLAPPAPQTRRAAPPTLSDRLNDIRHYNETMAVNIAQADVAGPMGVPDIAPSDRQALVEGMRQTGSGLASLKDGLSVGDNKQAEQGAVDTIEGFFKTATPAMKGLLLAAPVQTAIGLGVATTADKVAYETAKHAGASDTTATLLGHVAALAAGPAAARYGPAAAKGALDGVLGAASPVAETARMAALWTRLNMPGLTRAAGASAEAGIHAPVAAIERTLAGMEDPSITPERAAPAAYNEAMPAPVEVAPDIVPGAAVATPTGAVARVVRIEQPLHGTPSVVVQLPDGSAANYQPNVLTPAPPPAPSAAPADASAAPVTPEPSPRKGVVELPTTPAPAWTPADEARLVALNAPPPEASAAFPPVRDGESVRDYQRRTGTFFSVAKARVDFDVAQRAAAARLGVSSGEAAASPAGSVGGQAGVTGPAAAAVSASAREGRAEAPAPDVARAEALASAIRAHPQFAGVTVDATPEGHISLSVPGGVPVTGRIAPAHEMPAIGSSDNMLASLHVEAQANGSPTYTISGQEHPLPQTAAQFASLPPAHREAITSRFQVAGIYNPSTDTIHINQDFAHDPEVWGEEHFHAGVARLTPEERAAGVSDEHGTAYPLTTKAQEEAAYRAGVRVHPDVYRRTDVYTPTGIPGTLGQEGIHGRQASEAPAVSGAARAAAGSGSAGGENLGRQADAGGAGIHEGEARPGGAAAEVGRHLADDFDRLRAAVAQPDGGFTYSPHSGSPTSGYALSVTKGAERILDKPTQFTGPMLADYVAEQAAHWDDPRNYIGAWHNPQDGKVYLDVSTVAKRYEDAERLGSEHQQLAYYDLGGGRSYETRYAEQQRADQLARDAMPTVVRSAGGGAPTLTTQPEPSYAVRAAAPVGAYAPVEETASLESMMPKAQAGTFKTRRDLKVYMQHAVRSAAKDAGASLDPATPEGRAYVARVGVRDALFALQTNPNAVGWYDTTVGKALAVLSTIHPELATDAEKRFAFTFALAATSNGMKVNKNFQLAERAYEYFKRTGAMPTDVGEGHAANQINDAMKQFNTLADKWGMDDFRKFMLSQFTASEITRLGFDVGDEPADLVARGALIIGPKIGNGFFSNLNGYFDALTMDRWLMRTWGRWTGQLFYDNAKLVQANRDRTGGAVDALVRRSPRAAQAFSELLGIDLSKVKGPKALDRVAVAIRKSSEKPVNRAAMNKTALGLELRKAGNIHAQNLDGQKEAPDHAGERTQIRGVFSRILDSVKAQGHPALTTADLQALLWYPEKRLYDKATTQDEVATGYKDAEAPDYANAAVALARAAGIDDRRIADALDRGARDRTGRAGSALATDERLAAAAEFSPDERQAFLKRYARPGTSRQPTLESVTKAATASSAALPETSAPSYAVRERSVRERDDQGVFQGEDGPQVFYHGSTSPTVTAEQLDPTRPAVRARTGPLGLSFTTDPRAASGYTRVMGDKAVRGRVVGAHLAMQNPLDITDAIKRGQKRGLSFGDAKREALKELTDAHDGVVFRGDPYNHDEYVVFKPSQVRPAAAQTPSYAVRANAGGGNTLAQLQREATSQGSSLADVVAQARAEGRDIDVSDYFNVGRVNLPPDELQALKNEVIDTVVATGRVPKERASQADIRRDAMQLGGVDLEKELSPWVEAQAPYRAVRDAARHRINELSHEIFDARAAQANMSAEQAAQQEPLIAEKEQTVQRLLDTWMRIRSEDGRNLAMHGMMSDALGWDWTDNAYWFARAKRELALPQGVDLPAEVHTKLQDILNRGKQASDEARQEQGEEATEPAAETATEAATPGAEAQESRGPMTRKPPLQGPVLPPVESRGPMTRGAPVQGPVLPPVPSRGALSRGAPVQGPVLPPPPESRGPMSRPAPVQGPVLPPPVSRGRMTSEGRAPVQGPVLPPEKRRGRMTRRAPSAKEQAVQRELANFITKLKHTGFWEAVNLFRKAGLLTGVKTHLRNISGNAAFQVMEELSRAPASAVDMLISMGSGNRTVQGVAPRAIANASYEAATKGVQEAAQIMREGTHTPAQLMKSDAHREMNTGHPWLDAYPNFIFRTLSAEDRVFRSYAFRRSLEAQAAMIAKVSKGTRTAQDVLAKPTDDMLARAVSDAEFSTFNNPNVIARMWQQALATGRRAGPAGKVAAGVGEFIVPFTNTPANILARLIDYTPPGAAVRAGVAIGRGIQAKRSGGGGGASGGGTPPPTPQGKAAANALVKKALTPSQQEVFSMAVGRGFVGSAIMLLGYWLAQKGLATGIPDEDPGDRNVKEAAGKQPGAVKVGDSWRRVDTFSPVGNLLTLGASTFERQASPTQLLAMGTKTVEQEPMLQGASQLIQTLNTPGSSAEGFVSGQVGSFMPTLVSDAAAAFDPYRRETRPDMVSDSVYRGLQSRTPGLRNQLPVRSNVFGEPQAQAHSAIWDPTLPSRDTSNDVTDALQLHGVGIGKPPKAPAGLESDSDYRERAVAVGQAIYIRLQQVVTSPSYASLDFDRQTEVLKHAIAQAQGSVPRPRPERIAR